MNSGISTVADKSPTLDSIFQMQDIIQAFSDSVDMPITNHFSSGLYMREIFMQAGLLVVGKMHRTEHFNIIIQGACTVLTDDGPKLFTAPCIFISKPGVKKVLYTHEDTRWLTTHVTEETDMEKLEAELIVPETELRDSDGTLHMEYIKKLGLELGEVS